MLLTFVTKTILILYIYTIFYSFQDLKIRISFSGYMVYQLKMESGHGFLEKYKSLFQRLYFFLISNVLNLAIEL